MKLQTCLLLGISVIFFSFNFAEAEEVKVLILGAGVAGIMAAKTLKEKGLGPKDFLILEAQDYVGGRYKNVPFGNTRIEEGANWVHHTQDENALWDLAQNHQLKGSFTPYEDFVIRREDGTLDPDAKNILQKMHEAEEKLIELQGTRSNPTLTGVTGSSPRLTDLSLRNGLQMCKWKPQTPSEQVLEYFNMDFEFGGPPEVCSMSGFAPTGKDFFVHDPRGYGYMWKNIANDFIDRIRLSTVVTEVVQANEKVHVKTKSGDIYIADFALVTFSHGVLASDDVKFVPELPKWKLEAIYKMPMCYYTKIFIKFPKKFWDDNTWILYAHKNRGYFPVWMNVEMPGIAPNSGILHVTVTGEQALRVENQPKSKTLEEIMVELRKAFDPPIPNPEGIFVSGWSKNPYVQGSYSNAAPGMKSEDFHNLQTPVGRLYFAGEATSEDWWGYGNGAHETGEMQADRIWQCMKNKKSCLILPKANLIEPVTLDSNGNVPKKVKSPKGAKYQDFPTYITQKQIVSPVM